MWLVFGPCLSPPLDSLRRNKTLYTSETLPNGSFHTQKRKSLLETCSFIQGFPSPSDFNKTLTPPHHPHHAPSRRARHGKPSPEGVAFGLGDSATATGNATVFFAKENFRPNNRGYSDPPGHPSSKGVERSPGFFITPFWREKIPCPFCVTLLHLWGQWRFMNSPPLLNSKLSSPNRKGLLTIGTTGSRRQIILFQDEGSRPSMFWFLGLGFCGWRTPPSFGMMVDVWQG